MSHNQNDPILDEIHRVREELAARYQYNTKLITEAAKQRQSHQNLSVEIRLSQMETPGENPAVHIQPTKD